MITKTNSDKNIKQSKEKISNITVFFIKNKADYIIKDVDLNKEKLDYNISFSTKEKFFLLDMNFFSSDAP